MDVAIKQKNLGVPVGETLFGKTVCFPIVSIQVPSITMFHIHNEEVLVKHEANEEPLI